MTEANRWEAFFDRHAPHYMENGFTRATVAEVDFLLDLFALSPGARILDVGSGAGRHSVELARRGHDVTGLDLSTGMLAEARKAAEEAGVGVTFVRADATRFAFAEPFDAAICLCEGAFGLLNTGEDAFAQARAILGNIANAIEPGAPFVLTTLNGYRKIREVTAADVESGRFDPVTMVSQLDEEWELPGGAFRMKYHERLFTPPEVVALMRECGFAVEHVWGGTAGRWGRRPIDLDEMEFMVVARRIGTTR